MTIVTTNDRHVLGNVLKKCLFLSVCVSKKVRYNTASVIFRLSLFLFLSLIPLPLSLSVYLRTYISLSLSLIYLVIRLVIY